MARNLFDLTGRVVLAAGANSGIGLGFLMGCARQGADIEGPAAYLASDASRFTPATSWWSTAGGR